MNCFPHQLPATPPPQAQASPHTIFLFCLHPTLYYCYASLAPILGDSAATLEMTVPVVASGAGSRLPKRTPYRAARAFCLVTLLVAVIALYTNFSPRHAISAHASHSIEKRDVNLSLAEDLEVRIKAPLPTSGNALANSAASFSAA